MLKSIIARDIPASGFHLKKCLGGEVSTDIIIIKGTLPIEIKNIFNFVV